MIDPAVVAVIATLGAIVAIQGALSVRAKRTHKAAMTKFAIAGAKAVTATIFAAEREMARRQRKTIATTVDKVVNEIVAIETANGKSLVDLLSGVTTGYGRDADPLERLLSGDSPCTPTGRRRDPIFGRGRGFDGFTSTVAPTKNDLPGLDELLTMLTGGPSSPFGRPRPRRPLFAFGDLSEFSPLPRDAFTKEAGSADPLADPVEHTASGTVASDGGTTLESEANAEHQAEPVGEYGKAYEPPAQAGGPTTINERGHGFEDDVHHGSHESFGDRRVPRYAK